MMTDTTMTSSKYNFNFPGAQQNIFIVLLLRQQNSKALDTH